MQKLTFTCPNNGRKLRITLTALLKKGLITDARVQNSIKHYSIAEKKIKKEEKKLISLLGNPQEQDQILKLFSQISGRQFETGELQLRN